MVNLLGFGALALSLWACQRGDISMTLDFEILHINHHIILWGELYCRFTIIVHNHMAWCMVWGHVYYEVKTWESFLLLRTFKEPLGCSLLCHGHVIFSSVSYSSIISRSSDFRLIQPRREICMMLLVLQFKCYYSSSSDDMYSPSLHQERVSPHLRLLVHLESEEGNSSESSVILSATPPPFVPPLFIILSLGH